MKLSRITLTDFRCHTNTALDLAPVTVITGPNGSGKSSLAGALEFLFAGRCAWTDENGRGGNLGKNGGTGCVSIEAPNGDSVIRTTDGTLSCSWQPTSKQDEAQHALEAGIGCTGAKARLSLRAGRFFGLDSKAQKALLSDLLHLHITPDVVKAELTRLGEQTGMPLLATALRDVGREQMLADFPRAHKCIYEERTCVNRVVKDEKARLTRLEGEEKELLFFALDRIPELEKLDADICEQMKELNRKEGEARFAVANASKAEAELENAEAELAESMDVEMSHAQACSKMNSARDRLRSLEIEMEALRSNKTPCSACGQPTLDESTKIAGAELSSRIAKGRLVVQGLDALINRISHRRQVQHQVDLYREMIAKFVVPAASHADLSVERGRLEEQVDQVQCQLREARLWRQHQELKSQTLRELVAHEADAKVHNELVAFFAPDGFQARILSANLEPFENALSDILERFGMGIHYHSDMSSSITTREGAGVPFERLSDGEQVVVALAHQVAFAKLTGLGIVVIDRIEALDELRQLALIQACLALTDEVDHFILLGVRCEADIPDHVKHFEFGRIPAQSKETINA